MEEEHMEELVSYSLKCMRIFIAMRGLDSDNFTLKEAFSIADNINEKLDNSSMNPLEQMISTNILIRKLSIQKTLN